MLTVNDVPILAPIDLIISHLQDELFTIGINRFKDIKRSGNNVMVTCPFHKGGQERTPSFGINIHNGLCHCFTCGWKGTLEKFVSETLSTQGDKWLKRNFVTPAVDERIPLQINLSRRRNTDEQPIVSEEELDRYRYVHPYMYKRGLTDQLIEQFDVGYDKDFEISGRSCECITFPVCDLQGNPRFIARRSIHGKFFRYPSRASKPVYAANLVTGREVVVCESILNAITCWKHGLQAVALLGTGTDEQYEILRKMSVRKYIIGFDGDEAGRKAAQRFKNKLGKCKLVSILDIPDGTDINDLDKDILNLREFF